MPGITLEQVKALVGQISSIRGQGLVERPEPAGIEVLHFGRAQPA